MRRTILAPADLAGAALDELKDWLAIRSDAEDAQLAALLGAAIEACEGFTGTMPLSQQCEEIHPARTDWHRLATRPVGAILSVEGIPAEGSAFPFVSDAYEIDIEADGTGMVRILRQGVAGRIRVRFLAGLAPDWEALPESLRHGVLRLAAHLYRARDAGGDTAPPAAVTALWRPWRRLQIA